MGSPPTHLLGVFPFAATASAGRNGPGRLTNPFFHLPAGLILSGSFLGGADRDHHP